LDATAAGTWRLGDRIPGTGSSVHLEENVAAASLCLDTEDLARLDAAS
jgi:aryl-alcohol dehydrogenase-like predicted oxidoreductase